MSAGRAPVWPGPSLVVPTTLDALLVGQPDVTGSTWAATRFDYEKLLSGGSGEPPPLTQAPAAQVPGPGIHLLWTLPHALRSGDQLATGDDAGEVVFPLAPNRWLVARFEYPPVPAGAPPVVQPPTLRAWVLESDHLAPLPGDGGASQYPDPQAAPGDVQVLQVGRAVEIAAWDGPAAPVPGFLQAMGPGAVSWSASYDDVRNVFSFYDGDLAAAASPTSPYAYTYCVLGWYAAPSDDLLAGLPTDDVAAWMGALAAYRWSAGATSAEVEAGEAAWRAWQQARGLGGGPVDPDLPPQIAAWIARWKAWQAANGVAGEKPPLPTQTLCYGWVTNARWQGSAQAYGSGAPGGGKPAQAVAIGNTPTESIAAWIAKLVFDQYGYDDPAALPLIELALEAFQQGILDELDDDPVDAENTVHGTRFTQASGGDQWLVVRPEAEDGDAHSGQQGIPLDPKQTALLIELNAQQNDHDLLAAQLDSLRWELFAVYTKWVSYPRGTAQKLFDQVCAALCVLQEEIATTAQCVATLATGVETARAALVAALGDQFVCKQTALVPQSSPNDPVVMIGGLARDSKLAAPGAAGDDGDGTLAVRFTGQSVTGLVITVALGADPAPVTLTVADLLDQVELPAGNPAGYALPKEAPDLWAEVCFLDPSCAPLLAQIYFAKRGIEPTDAQWRQVVKLIQQQQTAPYAPLAELGLDGLTVADAVGIVGVPPAKTAVEYRGWPQEEQPWSPVFMDWQVRWIPSPGGFDTMLGDWQLGELDYQWTGLSIPAQGVDLVGRTVLNAETADAVTRQLEGFVADDPNFANLPQFLRDALAQTAAELADADIVSQSLAGLTDQMLTRATVMAYSFEALGDSRNLCDCQTGGSGTGSPVSAAAVDALLGAGFRATLQPIWASVGPTVPFFPVRAGHLQIVNLWVVDAFGQVLPGKAAQLGPNPIPNPFRADSMVTRSSRLTPEQNAKLASYVQLPPRLTQAARVRLRLLAAADEYADRVPATSADATSPICGWVVPNHLDGSLMVFDAAGENQGAILNVQRDASAGNPSGDGIRWDAVPGSEQQLGAPPALPNAHLQGFVQTLLELGLTEGGVLLELLGAIDSTLWTVDPFATREGNLAVLLGHPLAVVRADVALQLGGAPAYDQSQALTGQLYVGREGGKPVYQRRPAPFESVELGLRIGDLALSSNGVLGYFADDDYRHFYTAHGAQSTATAGVIAALREGRPVASALQALRDGAPASQAGGGTGYVVDGHLLPLSPRPPATPPADAAGCGDVTAGATTTKLTLLVDPFGGIPAIAGSLPVVVETLPSGPVNAALTRMKATFRIGPLLADPASIRMPLPAQVRGRWSWLARRDVVTWTGDLPVATDNTVNRLAPTPPVLSEGYLVLVGGEQPSNQ